MKNNKNFFYKNSYLLAAIISIIVVGFYLSFFNLNSEKENFSNLNLNQILSSKKESKDFDESCITGKEKMTVNGQSMEPLIKNGTELELSKDYYKCNQAKKGDIIAYYFAGDKNPLIKKIMADDQDYLEIKDNQILINKEVMKNSVGKEYNFSAGNLKMLGLYIKENKIPKDSYLIFGDNKESSLDSRRFGAVSQGDFLGRFILENN